MQEIASSIEPLALYAGLILLWPLAGWVVAAIRGARSEAASRRDPTAYAWSAAAGLATGAALLGYATSVDPTTSTEGFRALGIGLLGVATVIGAVLSGAVATALAWWARRKSPRGS